MEHLTRSFSKTLPTGASGMKRSSKLLLAVAISAAMSPLAWGACGGTALLAAGTNNGDYSCTSEAWDTTAASTLLDDGSIFTSIDVTVTGASSTTGLISFDTSGLTVSGSTTNSTAINLVDTSTRTSTGQSEDIAQSIEFFLNGSSVVDGSSTGVNLSAADGQVYVRIKAASSITGGDTGLIATAKIDGTTYDIANSFSQSYKMGTVDLTNAGTVVGTSNIGIQTSADTHTYVTNSGTITGGDIGLLSETATTSSLDGSIILTNSGTITGGTIGAELTAGTDDTSGKNITITNSNVISGGTTSIKAVTTNKTTGTGLVKLTNSLDGVLTGVVDINAHDVSITNAGSITATTGDAIDIVSESVTDSSTGTASGNVEISNTGTIDGLTQTAINLSVGTSTSEGGNATITNSGTIEGTTSAITAVTTNQTTGLGTVTLTNDSTGTITGLVDINSHDVSITNAGTITADGATDAIDIVSKSVTDSSTGTASGNVVISNTGTIDGLAQTAINLTVGTDTSNGGNATITNSGTITSTTTAITAATTNQTADEGSVTLTNDTTGTIVGLVDIDAQDVTVTNAGSITAASGTNALDITSVSATGTSTGDVVIDNSGTIDGLDQTAINLTVGTDTTSGGNATITNSGTITSTSSAITAVTTNQTSELGTLTITNTADGVINGTIDVIANAFSLINDGKIYGTIGSTVINVISNAVTTNGTSSGNIEIVNNGSDADGTGITGDIVISADAADVTITNTGGSATYTDTGYTITSEGIIGNITVTRTGSTLAGVTTLNNQGVISGTIDLSGETVVINNSELIEGIIYTNSTNIITLNNTGVITGGVINESTGAIYLDNSGTLYLDSSVDSHITNGSASNVITNSGLIAWSSSITTAVSKTISDVSSFVHSGVINLQTNSAVGDILTISGGSFISSSGSLLLDVFLGSTTTTAVADVLDLSQETSITSSSSSSTVVNSSSNAVVTTFATTVDSSSGNSATVISLKSLGGDGTGDTILLVSGVSTTGGSEFTLDGYVAAGNYIYDSLYYDDGSTGNTAGWYLVATTGLAPEIGTYLSNQNANLTLFNDDMSLHDRIGETRYTDAYRDSSGKRAQSLWLRVSGGRNRSSGSVDNYFKMSDNRVVVQLGGDAAQWDIGDSRLHFGFMAGYANSRSKSTLSKTGDTSKGEVTGYSLGLYSTWFQNTTKNTGLYVDAWGQAAAFKNRVFEGQVDESYRSHQWSASLETGYTFQISKGKQYAWFIEPEVQAIYRRLTTKDHVNSAGMEISDHRANGTLLRVGLRTSFSDITVVNSVQPYLTLNWYKDFGHNSITFDGTSRHGGLTKERYEAKLGMEGEIYERVQMYGHVAQMWGEKEAYRSTSGELGVKMTF